MAACCGKSKTTDAQEGIAEAAAAEKCPPNDLLLGQVHNLIDALGKVTPKVVKTKAMGQAQDDDEDAMDAEEDKKQISLQMSNALHTVNDLWQRNTESWSVSARNGTNSRVNISQQKDGNKHNSHEHL